MVHAALLLLMLEAAQREPRFTISLKRSTQNLQLSTSCRPITPSLGHSQHFALQQTSHDAIITSLFDHLIGAQTKELTEFAQTVTTKIADKGWRHCDTK
jgi:hypothetical protein